METTIINYDRVIEDKSIIAVVKNAAHMIMTNQYLSLQRFFNSLSDYDLNTLQEMIDNQSEDNLKNLLILSEMLSRSDGSYIGEGESESLKNVNTLCVYISCASLERKGLIDVMYENMTFGDDEKNKIIAKVKD